MNLRPCVITATAIVAGCLCLGLLLHEPSAGQQPAPAGQVGRYQAFAGDTIPNLGVRVIVCDTITGECHVYSPDANEGKGAWFTACPPWPGSNNSPKN